MSETALLQGPILLGPLVSLEDDTTYSICFLLKEDNLKADMKVEADSVVFTIEEPIKTHYGYFWRSWGQIDIKENGRLIGYTISAGNVVLQPGTSQDWKFYVPGKNEAPKFVYTSCNGFSSAKLLKDTDNPYNLWHKMNGMHQESDKHFSLLLMGGDQLYADGIWDDIDELKKWVHLNEKKQAHTLVTPALLDKLEKYYELLYISRWNEENQSAAFASIPNIMMWDDHDIFDGWGSYPDKQQNYPIHLSIFETAKKYFKLFQLRGRNHILDKQSKHFAFALNFRKYSILAMDHRSERTIKKIMSSEQWDQSISWFKTKELQRNLIILSAVPLVYRDFSFVESFEETTPWAEETEDDLRDHWRAREHQGERRRLIDHLLSELRFRHKRMKELQKKILPDPAKEQLEPEEIEQLWSRQNPARTVILSGDVHVGALGVIIDRRNNELMKIHQVVSSGIVHPPPSPLAWSGILATTNDDNEFLNEEKTIETMMLTPIGSSKYIRARNFATLHEGDDHKLWINWIDETKDNAEYPLD